MLFKVQKILVLYSHTKNVMKFQYSLTIKLVVLKKLVLFINKLDKDVKEFQMLQFSMLVKVFMLILHMKMKMVKCLLKVFKLLNVKVLA